MSHDGEVLPKNILKQKYMYLYVFATLQIVELITLFSFKKEYKYDWYIIHLKVKGTVKLL